MRSRAVSLLELVIAIVVIGLLAAFAIPRFGRAAGSAPDERGQLRERLRVLRVAVERYYQDHGAYPGRHGDGQNPGGTAAAAIAQLTRFTDEHGRIAEQRDAQHRFGPYLRDGVPACPIPSRAGQRGGRCGLHVISGAAMPGFAPDAAEAGWVYNCDTGQVACNSELCDEAVGAYASY